MADHLTFLSSPETVGSKTFYPDGSCTDYDAPFGPFQVTRIPVADLREAAQVLCQVPMNAFCVRGRAIGDAAIIPYRRSKQQTNKFTGAIEPPSLEAEAHHLLPIDIDEEHDGRDGRHIEACARAWRELLPECFRNAACFAAGSSSAGSPEKPGSKLRLWFWCSRPLTDGEAKALLQMHVRDTAIYQASQPIYVATPRFVGRPDFLAGLPRYAWIDGTPEVQVPALTREQAKRQHAVNVGEFRGFNTPSAGRNVTLTSLAGTMRARGMEEPAILAALSEHNRTFAEPLGESEVEKIAASVSNYEPSAEVPIIKASPAAEKALRKQAERVAQDPGLLADAAAQLAQHVRAGAITEGQAITALHGGITRAPIATLTTRDDVAAALAQAPVLETGGLPNWLAGCIMNDEGIPVSCPENLRIVLSQHPGMSLWFDSRKQQDQWQACPWHEPGAVLPTDDFALRAWLSRELGWHKAPADPLAAIAEIARQRPWDPWCEWLSVQDQKWDRRCRLRHAAPHLLGCENTKVNKLMFAWWLISAVARSLQPGCQVDHVLVLEGEQGLGKTSFLRTLAMHEQFFTRLITSAGDLSSPRVIGKIHGPVIVEMAELAALSKRDAESVKGFLDERFDRVQWLFARKPVDVARKCVFAASTNDSEYLNDPTGARRFWPLRVGNIRLDLTEQYREQLWAEAVYLYKRGVRWYPTRAEATRLGLMKVQESRRSRELGEDALCDLLGTPRQPGRNPLTGQTVGAEQLDARGFIVRATVTQLCEMIGLHPARDSKALARTLRALGWVSCRSGQARYWEAGDAGARGAWPIAKMN